MTKIKKLLLVYMLAQLVLGYTVAYAQTYTGVEAQISKYLCTPNTVPESQSSNANGAMFGGDPTGQNNFQNNAALNNNNNGILYQCINQIYKFSIVVASVVAVFFIVIAGYIYMSSDGDQEAVSRAKSILTSSIASIIILLIGYVFLRALNPDIVEFHSIQPPSVVINLPSGTNLGTGVKCDNAASTNYYVLQGTNYNIGPYATACNHESVVQGIYNNLGSLDTNSAQAITAYMQRNSANGKVTPITGQMVISACSGNATCIKATIAIMQTDSHFGTDGSRSINNCNPGNYGNTDDGKNTNFCNQGGWAAGVKAVADWLNRHKV